jgi:hypothetical protein
MHGLLVDVEDLRNDEAALVGGMRNRRAMIGVAGGRDVASG